MRDIQCVILAAGEGVRMRSGMPKVLHALCGRPMVEWAMAACAPLCSGKPVVVVGHGAEQVRARLGESARFATQEQRLGTGHAVSVARQYLSGHQGITLVLAGDMPLIETEHLRSLCECCEEGASVALLSANFADPSGYGRVVRGEDGRVLAIVEDRDADASQKQIHEMNAAIYAFRSQALEQALDSLQCRNAQGEYYLTDTIEYLVKQGQRVEAVIAPEDVCRGVNDRVQLAQAQSVLQRRINEAHMRAGVTLIDPENTYIGADVSLGCDVVVYPGNVIEGASEIGERAVIYPGCLIQNSRIGADAVIQSSQIVDADVGEGSRVGPFVQLRPHADVGNGCRVGNFVEIKNARVDDGAKVSHLSYIGDGHIGKKANIGCGVVFVNYDGQKKSQTVVGDGAFVGCNANLIAPVKVGAGAYVAAGSTITDDVPEKALGIARARQCIKEGWMEKRAPKT